MRKIGFLAAAAFPRPCRNPARSTGNAGVRAGKDHHRRRACRRTTTRSTSRCCAASARAPASSAGRSSTVSSNEDKLKQINGVQDLIARGVKGILISPIDAIGVNAAYDAAAAGKVPIVSVARGSTSPNQTLHVAMDEKQIGRDIAEWTAKKIGGKGKVAMLLGPSRRADVPQSRRRLYRGDGEISRTSRSCSRPTVRSPASAA